MPPPVTTEPARRKAVIGPGHSLASVTDKISAIVLTHETSRGWWLALAIGSMGVALLGMSVAWLLIRGTGVWGINQPVGWAFAIVNFVWWIGIGHAGTLISAILFLLRQRWRTSINRAAEAMTLFAVICAGTFPLIHVGRIWFAWWLFPIPTANAIWPQ